MKKQMFFIIFITLSFFSTFTHGALREYQLTIALQDITIKDKSAVGMTINGTIPGPTLRFSEGDLARIHVTNTLPVSSSIHWHGLLVPADMDGVPFVTQTPIAPGETFVYEFPIRQTGTYWYHSHSELQEQRGLYGSIVIADDKTGIDRDQVVLLSDWTTDLPGSIIKTLKRGSEWYSLQKGSAQSLFGAAKAGRLGDYFMRELQRMPPMDLADVAYDYFLTNGEPVARLEAKGGETVRLRVINGSATTYFHVNFSGGTMTVISADGQPVKPFETDLFLIGVAETYDILVEMPEGGSYELRATAHDGSGFTSTWLGEGRQHPARTIPKPNLYEPMEHGSMGSVFALTPAGSMGMPDHLVEDGTFDEPGIEHSTHQMPGDSRDAGMSGHQMTGEMNSSPEKSHSVMNPGAMPGPAEGGMMGSMEMPVEHGKMATSTTAGSSSATMQADTHEKMDHGQSDMSQTDTMADHGDTGASPDRSGDMGRMGSHDMKQVEATEGKKNDHVSSARSFGNKFGFLETDIASRQDRATEGGVQRPGTPYKYLKAQSPTKMPSGAAVREVRMTLDGDMERYTWFLNNKPLSETDSIRIREGEITRFIMINRTMMHHPMHLHGHFFRVINGHGEYSPLKHTVDVAPMSTTVIEFYGDEVGDWFFHCHLLYHMKSGMARLVHYEGFEPASDVARVRERLYKDPFYFYGMADISSNMTEGSLTLENSRYTFEALWEAGWQGVDETEWEGVLTADYHVNRFSSFFVGADFLGEGSSSDETRGVLGARYLLPLNIKAAAWVDSDGGARFFLEKEFELTPRVGLHGEVEYDTHSQWEGKVGLTYLISKDFSLIGNWHSEYGFGAGLQVRF